MKVKRLKPWVLPNKALAGTKPARGSVPLDPRCGVADTAEE